MKLYEKSKVKLKTAVLIVLAAWSISSFAQDKTIMYVMKNGVVVFSSPVSDVDNVTFDKAASNDALIVNKNDGSPAKEILLNDIQQISFLGENLLVETSNSSEIVTFGDIANLLLGDITTGINNPSKQHNLDVLVYVTPVGDVTVESSVAIKMLTLFSVDGRTISKQHCNSVDTQCRVSLQGKTAGVYLLRIETEQGVVVKKVVKPSNK